MDVQQYMGEELTSALKHGKALLRQVGVKGLELLERQARRNNPEESPARSKGTPIKERAPAQ